MYILELKNILSEIKNSLDRFKIILEKEDTKYVCI